MKFSYQEILLIVIIGVALVTEVYEEDFPFLYFSLKSDSTIMVSDQVMRINKPYFFLSDNEDIRSITVSSKEFLKKAAILVLVPERIDIPKIIRFGNLKYLRSLSANCKLYEVIEGEEFLVFNEETNIGYSIDKGYSSEKEHKSICNILVKG